MQKKHDRECDMDNRAYIGLFFRLHYDVYYKLRRDCLRWRAVRSTMQERWGFLHDADGMKGATSLKSLNSNQYIV
jgi:hypothetical protein